MNYSTNLNIRLIFKQATEISVEEGTTSTNDKTIASAYSQLVSSSPTYRM
jgi:arginine/lysine/ornithine decarboxylase